MGRTVANNCRLFSVPKSPNKPLPLGNGKTQGLFDINRII